MNKSLHIGFASCFGTPSEVHALTLTAKLHIRQANIVCWKRGGDEVITQEFDGRYGFIYSWEMHLATAISIPLQVARADIHALHFLNGEAPIRIYQANEELLCELAPERARYLYLPEGDYLLEVPAGETLVFGFYFDTKIFRQGNERPYEFIRALIEGKRAELPNALFSVDFSIGPRTINQIEHLTKNLKKGKTDNEFFIGQELFKLLNISREELLLETADARNKETIAKYVHEAIKDAFARHKHNFTIEEVVGSMKYSQEYYSRLHKTYYGSTLQQYKIELTIAYAKQLLELGETPTNCAYSCEFKNVQDFSRFFLKHAKVTPSAYQTYI